MARATKIKDIHIVYRNGRWTAVWQSSDRHTRVVRRGDTPELALIHLIAAEGPGNSSIEDGIVPLFEDWVDQNGLGRLRFLLLLTKGGGWNGQRNLWAVEVYREWPRGSTSGTSLGLGE